MELLFICTSIVLGLYALSLHRQLRQCHESYQDLCRAVVLADQGKAKIEVDVSGKTIAFYMGE